MGAFADHAKKAGSAVSGAYKAAGGYRGAAEHVRNYTNQNKADYQALHGNMPGAKEYIASDAGRATARHAAGGAFHEYLRKQAKAGARKGTIGGAVKNALFSFAHQALQSHMDALKHDQRIFENVAKVRRGDPEVKHLNHQQLREVVDHAHKYGGPHHEAVTKGAQGELDRRQERKNAEWDHGEAHRDNLKAARHEKMAGAKQEVSEKAHKEDMRRAGEKHTQSAGHRVASIIAESQHTANAFEAASKQRAAEQANKQAAHVEKLKRMAELRTQSGHTQASKLAHEAMRNKLVKEREAAKTKGVQARGTSVRATNASKVKTAEKLNIIGKTASGGLKIRAQKGGAVYTVGKEKAATIQKQQGAGKTSTAKAPRARRARSVG